MGSVARAKSSGSRRLVRRWTLRSAQVHRDEGETIHARVRRRSPFCALTGNPVLLCALLTLLSVHKHPQGAHTSYLMLLIGRLRRPHALRLGVGLVEPAPAHLPEP
jgi:hypothetical protein